MIDGATELSRLFRGWGLFSALTRETHEFSNALTSPRRRGQWHRRKELRLSFGDSNATL